MIIKAAVFASQEAIEKDADTITQVAKNVKDRAVKAGKSAVEFLKSKGKATSEVAVDTSKKSVEWLKEHPKSALGIAAGAGGAVVGGGAFAYKGKKKK